ncbi:SpoIIE family protein phosphatase [Streptomyces sp. NPDC002851]
MRTWDTADDAGFRGPLDATRAATAVLDTEGVIVGWSPQAEQLLGYPPQEALGRHADTLLARGEGDGEPWPFGRPGFSGVRGEAIDVRHRDGRMLRMAAMLCPLSGASGPGWLLVAADLEELRTWETHQSMLRGLATQSPVTLTIYSPELRLAWTNVAGHEELGTASSEYVGRFADELFPVGEVLTPMRPNSVEDVMREVLTTGEPVRDLHFRSPLPADPEQERYWSCSYYRLQDTEGNVLGVCEEAVDITDRYLAQQRLALLVEAGARIGRSLDVTQTAEELAGVAAPRFADRVTVDLLEEVLEGAAPGERSGPGPPPLVRVASRPDTAGAEPAQGTTVDYSALSAQGRSLATGRPVLEAGKGRSCLVVPLRVGDVGMGLVTFRRESGRETFDAGERSLADELVARTAVCVDNARRFNRERNAALSLQRSLLPRVVPPQTAVEVAYRYLHADAQAGVGGDWFDVIPLSGTRVGLVVGDVVGSGVRAAATMGRMRTTVRALGRLDLSPDELLSRLDDLIGQATRDWRDVHGEPGAEPQEAESQGAAAQGDEALGVTCVYAVYDPVSRQCSLARAGTLHPVVVVPGSGVATFPELPPGPPLGLGGLPFEKTDIELPEGSLIVLFTTGLIGPTDAGGTDESELRLERLGQIAAQNSLPLEELCDRMVSALRPGRLDDAALLLARTRTLGAHQVAIWELTSDPAMVGRARALATGQLEEWGLAELSFTTELIVSELVTNAVRYASGPIHLRLIRDRTLICEVSDTGHTSPHLRRAASDDEGGRGLFLVAQLTQLWGTRYTPTGKTIWAEQELPVVDPHRPLASAAV